MANALAQPNVSRKILGLFAAAAVAWSLTTLTDVGWSSLQVWFAAAFLDYDGYVAPPSQVLSWVALYAFFGLPVALIVCLVIGLPAWGWTQRRGLVGWANALKVGAGVGLFVGVVVLALSLWSGLSTALDDSASYNSWSWGRQVIKDGMPTLLGWVFWLIDLAVTVLTGCAAGAAAWWTATTPCIGSAQNPHTPVGSG